MATTDVSQYDGLLAQKKKLRRRAEIRKTVPLFLMMLPGLVYLFCNNYLPMFGILIAFKKVNFSIGILQSPWVGFQNFEFLFKTKDAWTMIRNTVCYNVVFITLGLVISVTIAIMMAEISSRKIAKVIQPIICFPSMVSAVILSLWLPQHYRFEGQPYQLVRFRPVLALYPDHCPLLAVIRAKFHYLHGVHRRH